VANGKDHDNAALIAMARTQGYRGPIYAFAEDPLHQPAMLRAGASEAFTPRLVLANTLASKASNRINPRVAGAQQISEYVSISELRIHANSPLAGCTLGEARIRERIVTRGRRTGADFVLSVSEVAGQMLAHKLIGEDYVSVEPQLKIVKVKPAAFVGEHPWRAGVRERSGCHLVAVERTDTVYVEFADDFRIEQGDALYLCGTPDALDDFFNQFSESGPV